MNDARRTLTIAIALIAAASLPAQASEASDAAALVKNSQATIEAFANHKDFPSLGPALGAAKAVLIFPQVVKAGFILGGSGGSGVLMTRDASTGAWVGPAFYTMASASLGLQAGASTAEVVMLVNSQKALDTLYTNKLRLGGDATIVAGPKGATAATKADFVAYSAVQGAFAGITVDGSVLDVRQSLNDAYYGKPVKPIEVLSAQQVSRQDAAGLQAALKRIAK